MDPNDARGAEGANLVRIRADNSLYSGHARCAAVAPEIFTLNDEGYVAFSEKTVPADVAALAGRGADACAERALRLVENGRAEWMSVASR
jgi:ferredoxin